MAKFCENCGAAMDDGDAVCGQCGTPVGSVGGAGPQTNSGVTDSQPKVNNGEPKALNANNSAFMNISSQVGQAIHNEQYGEGSYEDMIDNFLETKLDNYEDQVDDKVKFILLYDYVLSNFRL